MIEIFKSLPEKQRKKRAPQIFKKYFDEKSPYVVYIDNLTKEEIFVSPVWLLFGLAKHQLEYGRDVKGKRASSRYVFLRAERDLVHFEFSVLRQLPFINFLDFIFEA